MEACHQLARALDQNPHRAQHKPEIRSLFEKACSGKIGAACYNRAQLCDTDGVHFADQKAQEGIVCARQWFTLACQHGWASGCAMSQSFNDPRFGQ